VSWSEAEVAQAQLFAAAPCIWAALSSSRSVIGIGLSPFIALDPHAGSGGGFGRKSVNPSQRLGIDRSRHLGELEPGYMATSPH
jgi:hypothetical protein